VHGALESKELTAASYQQLAEFRYRIRRFLHFSEEAARENGLEPQQHQLLLAVKGLPPGTHPTVKTLSDRMCLRHHSTVELINRLADRGAIVRRHSTEDRRQVFIELTPHGEHLLRQLSVLHFEELQNAGPTLVEAVGELLGRYSKPTQDLQ
jgi:DNA-binding MarR family transcriptional regulator